MKRTVLTMIGIWAFLTGLYAYSTVSSKLSLPPTGDLYAHTLSFQVFQFAYFKLLAMVLLLAFALATQVVLARVSRIALGSRAKRLLRTTLWLGAGFTLLAALWHNATATTPYNPYFQRDEQLALQFMATRLPLVGLLVGVVLAAEWRWLSRGAS